MSVNVGLKCTHTCRHVLSEAVFMADHSFCSIYRLLWGASVSVHHCSSCLLSGAVPGPESLLFSSPPKVPQVFPSTLDLMASSGPSRINEVTRVCENNEACVHDTLASNMSDLGLLALSAEKRFQSLAVLFGESVLHPHSFLCHSVLLMLVVGQVTCLL